MSKKTMAECLANGDFEEAFYRWVILLKHG